MNARYGKTNGMVATVAGLMMIAMMTGASSAAVVLDDYSTANAGDYNQYRFYGAGSASFAVSGGVFDPTQSAGNTFGWMWNSGSSAPNTLNPGEWISVDVSPEAFATQIGFRLAKSLVSNGSTTPGFTSNGVSDSFIIVNAASDTNWILNINNIPAEQTPLAESGGSVAANVFVNLKITRGTGAQQNELTVEVSGLVTGSDTYVMSGVLVTDPLYFALEKYSGGGASSGQFDNLTHSFTIDVPGPAAMPTGLAGLGLVLARRRRAA